MKSDTTALSPEEIARRGDEIYSRVVRGQVEGIHDGKIVAIDVLSEAYVLDDSRLAAAKRLEADRPNAEVWFVRVGHDSALGYSLVGASADRHRSSNAR